jgi:copper chaperone
MAEQVTLPVSGMSCQHCVGKVEKSVSALPGIDKVDVSLEDASVKVAYDNSSVSVSQITEAIEGQGYEVGAAKE